MKNNNLKIVLASQSSENKTLTIEEFLLPPENVKYFKLIHTNNQEKIKETTLITYIENKNPIIIKTNLNYFFSRSIEKFSHFEEVDNLKKSSIKPIGTIGYTLSNWLNEKKDGKVIYITTIELFHKLIKRENEIQKEIEIECIANSAELTI